MKAQAQTQSKILFGVALAVGIMVASAALANASPAEAGIKAMREIGQHLVWKNSYSDNNKYLFIAKPGQTPKDTGYKLFLNNDKWYVVYDNRTYDLCGSDITECMRELESVYSLVTTKGIAKPQGKFKY